MAYTEDWPMIDRALSTSGGVAIDGLWKHVPILLMTGCIFIVFFMNLALK